MTRIITHALLPTLLLAACSDGASFNDAYATMVCDKLDTCAPGALEAGFGDGSVCEQGVGERLGRLNESSDCRFDLEAAEDCLVQTERLSCEVWLMYGEPDACAETYTCAATDTAASSLDAGLES